MEIRRLTIDDVGVVAAIDRSEHVDREYEVVEGELRERPVTMVDIPAWTSYGTGSHTVASKIDFCHGRLVEGGQLLAAFEGKRVLGVAVVEPAFDPPLARLAFLHVSRPYRRSGVGAALWRSAVRAATGAAAEALYVSATPTGSTVDFYLSQGCALATPPHPRLFDEEPDDIHLVSQLGRSQVV
jgi:ribosomal protein S18 acetylase RimI-like enzyme